MARVCIPKEYVKQRRASFQLLNAPKGIKLTFRQSCLAEPKSHATAVPVTSFGIKPTHAATCISDRLGLGNGLKLATANTR